jgi:hypothetical protein
MWVVLVVRKGSLEGNDNKCVREFCGKPSLIRDTKTRRDLEENKVYIGGGGWVKIILVHVQL